jgi:hypothetical protein
MAKMVRMTVGTCGLMLARNLYGPECTLDMGDWLTPATIQIPDEDADVFCELHADALLEAKLTRKSREELLKNLMQGIRPVFV